MTHSQQLVQHLHELGLAADQILNQLPDGITLSSLDGVLCLYETEYSKSKLSVDFIHGALSYRSQQHLGAENLIKACQIKGQERTTVLDGTCGLGTDSFLLSQAGFQVTAVEKHAIIHALLLDGIRRYQLHTNQGCFELVSGDVVDVFNQWQNQQCDVIYLDPMFPNKAKSAKNKKTMQLFQSIHTDEADDAGQLLALALSKKCKRVVIKRPAKAPLLSDFKPTFQIVGKTCRFDAYQKS